MNGKERAKILFDNTLTDKEKIEKLGLRTCAELRRLQEYYGKIKKIFNKQ